MPGVSPGARIQDGTGTSSAASRWLVQAVRRRIHEPGRHRRLLGEFLDPRGLLDDLMDDRRQVPLAIGAEPEPLDGRRAIAGQAKHLLPRQRQLHRPARDGLRGEAGQHVMGVWRSLGTKAAADMRSDHPDLLRAKAEQGRQHRSHGVHALGRVVQGELAIGPGRDGGVRLHRIVVFHRRRVGLIHRDRRRRQRRLDIALVRVGRIIRVDLFRCVQIGTIRAQLRLVRLLGVRHPDHARRLPRDFRSVRDHRANKLSTKANFIGLQYP